MYLSFNKLLTLVIVICKCSKATVTLLHNSGRYTLPKRKMYMYRTALVASSEQVGPVRFFWVGGDATEEIVPARRPTPRNYG